MTILLLICLTGIVLGSAGLGAFALMRHRQLLAADRDRQAKIEAFKQSLDVYEELRRDLEIARQQGNELERLNLQHRIATMRNPFGESLR